MKKILAMIVLLAMSAGTAVAGSDNPLLLGAWKSDKALTTQYNSQIDHVNKNMAAAVDQKTGHMVISFATDRVTSTGAPGDIQIDGMAEHRAAHDLNAPYSIVSGDEHSISISMRDDISGFTSVMEFGFDDHDTMWVRAGGPDMRVADTRLRVYFKRVH